MREDRLDNQVAIVTGAARGIGAAIARRLSRWGASVVLVDLDLAPLAESRHSFDGPSTSLEVDLTRPETGDQVVRTALDAYGRLDIVVNNAGYTWDGPLHKMSDRQFQAMLDIHTLAPFRILRAAAGPMRAAAKQDILNGHLRHRKVVNLVSLAGLMGQSGNVNYSAAKGATIALTKALAKEWGPLRINVNAVAPGFIDTRLTATSEEPEHISVAGETHPLGMRPEVRELAVATNSLGRIGTVDEVAGAAAWLASPASDYVNGHVLTVSGGQIGGMTA
jgi:3-oxoacyl-[acyl-carrier protein] reductase